NMRRSLELDRFRQKIIRHILGVAALPLLFSSATMARQAGQANQINQANQARQQGSIKIITQDETNIPILGVTIQVKQNSEILKTIKTDEKGEGTVADLPPGTYEIVVSREGFETRSQQGIVLAVGGLLEVKFTLVPKIALNDKVDITATATPVTPEKTSSVA